MNGMWKGLTYKRVGSVEFNKIDHWKVSSRKVSTSGCIPFIGLNIRNCPISLRM